jgi:glycosyltransferase involved in cell wall biosynthesis
VSQQKKTISIIVPVFNEQAGVKVFYSQLSDILDQIADFEFEIIFIEDGSTDDTLIRLISLVETDQRVRIIELSRNFGKEAAISAGLDAAIGDAAIPMDVDLQDPPELITTMIEAWSDGAEVVLARRICRSSDSFLKRKTAESFYNIHNRLSDTKIPANVGDFRLIDKLVIDAIKQLPEQQRFMKGLFAWVGFKAVTIDYARTPRSTGNTKFSGWKLWNFALEGITSFSSAPLKLWFYIGGAGALLTLLYAMFIIIRTITHGIDIPGYASLLVAILFLGSLQLVSIGMLGEYIGRIYMETKCRPLYLIRKQHGGKL